MKPGFYKNTAGLLNYLAALVMLVFGLIYLLKSRFMPYHSVAVSQEWHELSAGVQFVIIALMRVAGGGYLVAALCIVILQRKYCHKTIRWIPDLILAIGLIIGTISIYATLIVRSNTDGEPPTILAVIGVIFIIAAYVFNRITDVKS